MLDERGKPIFEILTEGNWPRAQVRGEWAASTWASNEQIESRIESAWQKASERAGIHLFDGPMCRLESFSADVQRLELRLSQTSYRIFVGTNLSGAKDLSPKERANPIGLSAALVTIDGRLLLGRRTAHVAYYPNRVHPFAGALEPKDSADIFSGMLRELDEELGLKEPEIESIECIGLASDCSIAQPEMIFAVRTQKTELELAATMDAGEHRGIWSAPADEHLLKRVREQRDELTPIALATMTLWGASRFGRNV